VVGIPLGGEVDDNLVADVPRVHEELSAFILPR
jgi:hypothetical protein